MDRACWILRTGVHSTILRQNLGVPIFLAIGTNCRAENIVDTSGLIKSFSRGE